MGGCQWPVGSVKLLFTDIEGSTRLIEELGDDGYVQALAEHRRLLREAFSLHRGVEVDMQGDAFLYAFADAGEAFAAASDGQEALATTAVRVRMGLHTGELRLTGEGYAGRELHRASRIAAAGHGGQVVVSATTRSLVDGELTELGEHRLKDFPQPVALFQVGRERFPPLKTISNTNLPRPVSSFVGREREREELVSMLADGTRLVTLSGPGGSGKTRLAVEAATELVPEFKAGVFWVGLSALRDPALVTETIAQVLGAKEGLAEHIGERELLLVPDNFEQVVDAAPELATLLEACPNLKLLVTSRELLRIRGEVEYAVPPLAEPEGLQLFCERSRLEPGERIAELCRRLDELPLALELAAARTSVLSPAQILERLSQRLDLLKGGRDAEARQQTLRATIEWSHDLLGEDERRLFARVAVFQGGCTLEAAEHVCDAELDVLESLVDKSLVRVREGDRFWMLETIRAYALERLEASGEAESLRARHAEQIRALCVEAEPEILGVAPKPALDQLDRELENIRGALDWLEESGRFEEAMQIGGATWEFWCLRNRWGEGWRRLERLLETEAGSPSLRAGVLLGSAHLAPAAGPAGEALQRLRAEESLALQRELGDPWGIAFAEFQLATAHFEEGDFAGALPLCEQSVERMREIGDEHRACQALEGLTMCCRQTGDLERANALAQQLRDEARAAGDGFMESAGLLYLSLGARDEGRFADALALLNECHRFVREFGSTIVVGLNLLAFASTLAKAGDHEAAARTLGCAQARRREADTNFSGYMARELLDPTDESARSALGEETFAAAWEQGLLLTADEAVELALRTPTPLRDPEPPAARNPGEPKRSLSQLNVRS